jgi:DNA segregation ATPase FtsK/SpoIIIE-like protein
MNGRNVASSMYILTNRDIIELKSKLIKLVGFNINGQPVGLNLTKNKDILIKEFLGLN